MAKVLFVKPPDRFLENEFVYPQLGPHYLQSYLEKFGILSDILILYQPFRSTEPSSFLDRSKPSLNDLNMLLVSNSGHSLDTKFDINIFGDYDVIGMSVMTPQAPDAYLLNQALNKHHPEVTTVIGGSHPRYYQQQVSDLPDDIAFDFIVPQDGWKPMLDITSGVVFKDKKSIILTDKLSRLNDIPPPSRPKDLLARYHFNIGGIPAFHTITALGCPFTCHFCESGLESVRTFSATMINEDLKTISETQSQLGQDKRAVMFFDDVGLMSPKQVARLSRSVSYHGFVSWRAFTHAYLITRHRDALLEPFVQTGGKRVGIGIETGSQRSLDMINKRNGKTQLVSDHYESVRIANDMGVAVDAFTMIYPWEDHQDLEETTKLVEFVASNPVNGTDELGRVMKNHVDSTIMSPYQGTKFFELIQMGKLPNVEIDHDSDPGNMYYKGSNSGSGWPYLKTRLPKTEYEAVQRYRNSLRPDYR